MKTIKRLMRNKKAVVSTQRLLMIVIAMNVIIGVISHFYLTPQSYNENIIIDEVTFGEITTEEVEEASTYARVKSSITSTLGDNTIGATAKMGFEIGEIIYKGVVPFPIQGIRYDDPIERTVAHTLDFFRYLMWAILILELYLLWKNKKAT